MIVFFVIGGIKNLGGGEIRRARRFHAPQLTKRLGRHPIGQHREPLGIALGHVELAVGRPIQAVEAVLEIAEIGVKPHVIVGHLIAVRIAHHRQVRRIGHPQRAVLPREALDVVEAGGETLASVGHPVVVLIEQNPN